MKGWFDAFRVDGGPILYSYSNRTAVNVDVTIATLCTVFIALYIAFLIIFLGVRKQKFTTFFSVTLSLFVGSSILVSKCGSSWHVASTDIVSSYRAFSREKISADLGAFIGLAHVNITLTAAPARGNASEDVDYNERFAWSGANQMVEAYHEARVRGLPFPILTVAEYLSQGVEGFNWGGQYRLAGYYAGILLWASFATWLLMNLLLVVVPRYGAYTMTVTGGLLLATDLTYYSLIPSQPMVVRFEDHVLEFQLGWCFYLVLVAGGCCVFVGLVIATVDHVYINRFSTILEVDFDTPYDRHIIIEDSNTKRAANKTLEEPASLGSRLLRRISSKKIEGLANEGFEMDPPKSPWRYPFTRGNPLNSTPSSSQRVGFAQHRPIKQVPPRPQAGMFQRSMSQDSASSVSSSGSGHVEQVCSEVHGNPQARRNPTAPVASKVQEVAMW